jgi:lipase chaperone LimK
MDGFDNLFNERAKIIEASHLVASVQFAYYQSLVDEGFTEEQAIRIIEITQHTIGEAAPRIMEVSMRKDNDG